MTEAVAWARQAYAMAPWHSHPPAVLAGLLVQSGERPEAEALLATLPPQDSYGVPTTMTFFHLLSGELDSAADWSEKAIEQRDPRLVLGLQQPMAAAFRAHPRGEAILRKMNLLSV
jgi:hypothetical protein